MKFFLFLSVVVGLGLFPGVVPPTLGEDREISSDALDQRLMAALRAFSEETERFPEWLQEHPEALDPRVAERAMEVYRGAVSNEQWGLALGTAMVASFLFLILDQPYEALAARVAAAQVLFRQAVSEEEHAEVRNNALQTLEMAKEVEAEDVLFQAAVLAADSAFFAGVARSGDPASPDPEWLLTTLDDLRRVVRVARGHQDSPWFAKLLSLLATTVELVESHFWFEGEEVRLTRDGLRDLALFTERSVTYDYDLETAFGPARALTIQQQLAGLSFRHGSVEKALERIAAATRRAEALGDIEMYVTVAFQQYTMSRDAYPDSAVLSRLRGALRERGEAIRQHYRSRTGRLWAAQRLDEIYGEMLRDEAQEKNANPASLFHAIESMKARVLLDEMDRSGDERNLSVALEEAERAILRFDPHTDPSLMMQELRLVSRLPFGAFAGTVGDHLSALRDIELQYEAEGAEFGDPQEVATLREIQSALEHSELLIEFSIPHSWSHPAREILVMAVTREKAEWFRVSLEGFQEMGLIGRLQVDSKEPIDASPLGDLIATVRVQLQRNEDEDAHPGLRTLYGLLIEPLVERGFEPKNFRTWILVPHGPLHAVPFAALIGPEGRFLIEDVALLHAPSASVWYRLAVQEPSHTERFLGLANPRLDRSDLPPLGESERELQRIVSFLPEFMVSTYVGKEATETVLRREAASAEILHFATHGDFPEQDIFDFHQVLLAPDAEQDGEVNAREFRKLDLSAARLVVLSICNGSVFRFGPGDEPYGLLPALLTAGAQNILGVQWPVEDHIGRQFMGDFYEHLQEDSPSKALRRTAIQSIEDGERIRRWAGFVLMGDGRAIYPSEAH